jgi:hypothetical protein
VESHEKTFQFFFSHRLEKSYYLDGISDMMNEFNINLLCIILIAVQSPVRGIVTKVQDVNSELQLSTEMLSAGMDGGVLILNLWLREFRRFFSIEHGI